jgi:inner membrane protein
MPTIFTHAIVPLAVGAGLGRAIVPPRLLIAGMAVAVLPDLDVVGLQFGVGWGTTLGHRGFSHSLVVAAAVALLGACAARNLGSSFARAFLFLFFSMASHGLLDALTNGGSGIALLWPFSGERFFAPYTPIEVSPIGLSRFLSERGARVMVSEILWVWLPVLALLVALRLARRTFRASPATRS